MHLARKVRLNKAQELESVPEICATIIILKRKVHDAVSPEHLCYKNITLSNKNICIKIYIPVCFRSVLTSAVSLLHGILQFLWACWGINVNNSGVFAPREKVGSVRVCFLHYITCR